jgi:hypothetical protein
MLIVDTHCYAPQHWFEPEGVRLEALTRSPVSNPLAIWRKAVALGIAVSIPGSLTSGEFAEVGQAFPTLPMIIEHLGGIGWSDAPPYPIFRQILALAQYPNTVAHSDYVYLINHQGQL